MTSFRKEYMSLERLFHYYRLDYVHTCLLLKITEARLKNKNLDVTEQLTNLEMLQEAKVFMYDVVNDLELEKKRNFDLEFINLKLMTEIADLKKQIEVLNKEKEF